MSCLTSGATKHFLCYLCKNFLSAGPVVNSRPVIPISESSGFKPLPKEEVDICHRLAQARRYACRSQAEFAKRLGMTRSQLANLESARVPLRFWTAWRFCYLANVNQYWLATGSGYMNPFVAMDLSQYADVSEAFLFSEAMHMKPLADTTELGVELELRGKLHEAIAGYLTGYTHSFIPLLQAEKTIDAILSGLDLGARQGKGDLFEILMLLDDLCKAKLDGIASGNTEADDEIERQWPRKTLVPKNASKQIVDSPSSPDSLPPVRTETKLPQNWSELRALLVKATQEPGAKARLAEAFNTTRQAVHKWLSGAGAPSADLALRLAAWATGPKQARKQSGPESAATVSGPAARSERIVHELIKSKSSRGKH